MKHRLSATRPNLHGTYHRSNPAVLEVESGDTISFETLEVGWRTERVVAGKPLQCVPDRDPVKDDGPALTGPVRVRGAMPGMTLEVRFLEFESVGWGWTSAGGPAHRIPELTGVREDQSLLGHR